MAEGECLKVGDKEFCYSRKQPCPCSKAQSYKDHHKAEVDSWGKYLQTRNVQKGPTGRQLESYSRAAEHHHIICVASVGVMLAANDVVKAHAEGTNWCINEKRNLVGLPMWPLHIGHYCSFSRTTPEVRTTTSTHSGVTVTHADAPAPPFKDLPMHDQDHDLYIDEIESELIQVASNLELVEDCQDPDEALKSELDRLSDKYGEQLLTNGTINQGTHRNWENGIEDPYGDWYKPFSMSRSPRPLIHPMSSFTTFEEKLNKYQEAFWLQGQPVHL